jgi:hypothetical protein
MLAQLNMLKTNKNGLFRRVTKNIFRACGFFLRRASYCASLRPVSQRKKACKLLKKKYLKQYFKYQKVFHSPVENPVENFLIRGRKRGKRVILQHLPSRHSKNCLSEVDASSVLFQDGDFIFAKTLIFPR